MGKSVGIKAKDPEKKKRWTKSEKKGTDLTV